MNFYKLPVIMLAFFLVFAVKVSYAQYEEVKVDPNGDMDNDQWEAQITDFTAKKNDLTTKIADLQKEIDELTAKTTSRDVDLRNAEDAFWSEVGGKENYGSFKSNLERLEKVCRNKEGSKEDAMKIFESMSTMKMKCHPEFFARFNSLKKCLEGWNNSVPQYVVLKGDYLFIIAARNDVYNNKHMWPVIWEANENGVIEAPRGIPKTIKNPHLIYPGQVLKIPAMSESLKKSSIFDRSKGWLDWKNRRNRKK
ncbi:MAG: LysM peptidoglycan-binding domain-containing protein [Ignavibacteriota bacterium]|nr:LysM peptidoglycan-binding domain-containing protein [Ignavibacteriota bacterium]